MTPAAPEAIPAASRVGEAATTQPGRPSASSSLSPVRIARSPRGQIRIPAPLADRGDHVEALNYRRRPAEWESALVTGLRYENNFGSFGWAYDVALFRFSGRNSNLYVGDDGIRKVRGGA
jgi:hypothetical protein